MAVACRVLEVSTLGYYEWAKRPPSARDLADAYLLDTIIEVHTAARQTYGIRRVHAELTLTDVIAASTFSVFEAMPDVKGLPDPRYCVDPRIADRADAWLIRLGSDCLHAG